MLFSQILRWLFAFAILVFVWLLHKPVEPVGRQWPQKWTYQGLNYSRRSLPFSLDPLHFHSSNSLKPPTTPSPFVCLLCWLTGNFPEEHQTSEKVHALPFLWWDIQNGNVFHLLFCISCTSSRPFMVTPNFAVQPKSSGNLQRTQVIILEQKFPMEASGIFIVKWLSALLEKLTIYNKNYIWEVNGTQFFCSFPWNISGWNGTLEKVHV